MDLHAICHSLSSRITRAGMPATKESQHINDVDFKERRSRSDAAAVRSWTVGGGDGVTYHLWLIAGLPQLSETPSARKTRQFSLFIGEPSRMRAWPVHAAPAWFPTTPWMSPTESMHSPLFCKNITYILNTSLGEILRCPFGRYSLSRTRATRDGRVGALGRRSSSGRHRLPLRELSRQGLKWIRAPAGSATSRQARKAVSPTRSFIGCVGSTARPPEGLATAMI